MPAQTISTPSNRWHRLLTTNDTTANFPTVIPTATNQAATLVPAAAVIEMGGEFGGEASSGLVFIFFGVGSNANTFKARVFGWSEHAGGNVTGTAKKPLWMPQLLASVTCTLNTSYPGIDNTAVDSTNFFVTTMTEDVGNPGISSEVISPITDIAHLVIDAKGSQFVEVKFAIASGSTTSMNALFRRM